LPFLKLLNAVSKRLNLLIFSGLHNLIFSILSFGFLHPLLKLQLRELDGLTHEHLVLLRDILQHFLALWAISSLQVLTHLRNVDVHELRFSFDNKRAFAKPLNLAPRGVLFTFDICAQLTHHLMKVLVEFCRQLLICSVVVLPSSFLGIVAAQGANVLVNKGYGFKVLWVQVLQA
jgi:hypothetical protein